MEDNKLKKILSSLESAVELIDFSRIYEAIKILKFLEERFFSPEETDPDLKIIAFHNLATCYQVQDDKNQCRKYLKKTLKVVKGKTATLDVESIRMTRYSSLLLIHLSALSCHSNDHELSLNYAKQAFDKISKCIELCITCSKIQKSWPSYEESNIKILEACLLFLSGKLSFFPYTNKIVRRTSLGVLHYTDWIFSYSIDNLLDLIPMKYFELKNGHTLATELSKDYMAEKICLLIFSCYLVATELRSMQDNNEILKAKGWHSRAIDIGLALLPLETPLLQHIKSSFDKYYPPSPLIPKTVKSKSPNRTMPRASPKFQTPQKFQIPAIHKFNIIEISNERKILNSRIKIEPLSPGAYQRAKTNREKNALLCDYSDIQNTTVNIISYELYGAKANLV